MSVLSRPGSLRRTPAVPTPRPPAHDGGIPATTMPSPAERTAAGADRTSRRRRAALVLIAIVLAVAAAATTAVLLLTGGDEPARPAPSSQLGGVTELDRLRDEAVLRRHLSSDSSRAGDAARDASLATR